MDGFIADVINGGLSATTPVEMVIRASAPTGTQLVFDSLCSTVHILENLVDDASLGTDAWDALAQDLDQSHQSIRSFDESAVQGSTVTFQMVSHQYIRDLDNAILNNYPTDTNTCYAAFTYSTEALQVSFTDQSNMNGNQYIIWDFGDGSPVEHSLTPVHTYASEGDYFVCLYNVNNGDTCASQCTTINVSDTGTGIMHVGNPLDMRVYPNPVSETVTVKLRQPDRVATDLELVSLVGRMVRKLELSADGTADVRDVAPGMYFIRARMDGQWTTSNMLVISR